MNRRLVFWIARVLVTGALAALAFVNYQSSGPAEEARKAEVEALLTASDTSRVPAVVETAELAEVKVRRRGQARSGMFLEGAVRTEAGDVLEFRHDVYDASSPGFAPGDEVLVVSADGDTSGVWLVATPDMAVTNASAVITPVSGLGGTSLLDVSVLRENEQVALGALVVSGLLLLAALRSFPRTRREVPVLAEEPTA